MHNGIYCFRAGNLKFVNTSVAQFVLLALPKNVKLQPVFRLAMEDNKQVVLDQKDALLLRRISETHSLTEAAKLAEMSYRRAWDRIKAVESNLGVELVKTRVGGAAGGSANLTPAGAKLLQDFRKVRKYLFNALDDRDYMVNVGLKLSARNRVKAKIVKVEKGTITGSVKMKVVAPSTLTSIISTEAIDDLELKEGDEVEAIIKSTEVMIAKRI